ncbi:rhox homeobox family member 2B [Callithrix jacchus]|uniref:Rhox homeobox family member 2B n=1 Tax=Callithrix jacchus TaxID=9483 RepID=F7I3D3_CALJA|nr:rhox homeobox family member 2B [Callithrix jacchus]
MEPLDRSSQGTTSLLSPEVDEEDVLQGVEAAVLSLIEESDKEEEEAQPKPEQGTAATAQKSAGANGGEEKVGGGVGTGAPGPVEDENHEGISSSNGNDEHSKDNNQEPGQQEPPRQGASSGPEPDNMERPFVHPFTPSQRRELEGIFRRTQFPSEFLRRALARRMNVTEVVVQIWFENRRARWRRHQRALNMRNASHPIRMGQLVIVPLLIPYNTILIQGWYGRWFVLEPQPVWQPLPMAVFPPLFFSPSPLFYPPMPPPVQAQFGPFFFVIVHFFTFSVV